MSEFASELLEAEHLLTLATFNGTKAALQAHVTKLKKAETDRINLEAAAATALAASSAKASDVPATSAKPTVKGTYIPIEDYAWDQGEYNSPTVSIYIDLDGVGAAKDRVEANFTSSSFDLKITDLNGKNYRLVKDNLEKPIVADKCKVVVKSNKIVLKLQKTKGEFSFDHWTSLTTKKKKAEDTAAAAKKDPMGGQLTDALVFLQAVHNVR